MGGGIVQYNRKKGVTARLINIKYGFEECRFWLDEIGEMNKADPGSTLSITARRKKEDSSDSDDTR